MSDQLLQELFEVLQSRKGANPKESYTAKLYDKGKGKICQKVGEEASEVIIAALSEGKQELILESADLLYHLLVLLSHCDVNISEVMDELCRRQSISGIEEKKKRSKDKD